MLTKSGWTAPRATTLDPCGRSARARGELLAAISSITRKDIECASMPACEFRERNGGVEVHVAFEAQRGMSRDDFILVGALLANAHLALRARGPEWKFTVMPAAGRSDCVARLTPMRLRPLSHEETQMWAVATAVPGTGGISERDDAALQRLLVTLQRTAQAADCWLECVSDPARRTMLADLAAFAAHVCCGEREAWAIAGRHGAVEPRPPDSGAALRHALPRLGAEVHHCLRASEIAVRRSIVEALAVLVIGTRSDSPADWLRTGVALQRLLLLATAAGLSTAVHTEATQQPATRAAVRSITFAQGWPQIVLGLEVRGQRSEVGG